MIPNSQGDKHKKIKRRGTFNFLRGGAIAPFLEKGAIAVSLVIDMELVASYFSRQSDQLFEPVQREQF